MCVVYYIKETFLSSSVVFFFFFVLKSIEFDRFDEPVSVGHAHPQGGNVC